MDKLVMEVCFPLIGFEFLIWSFMLMEGYEKIVLKKLMEGNEKIILKKLSK